MFTADPEQAKKWGYDPAICVTSEEVAEAMIDLVVKDYAGGTSIEVAKSGTRELGVWNIAAPIATGTGVSQSLDQNYARLTKIMDSERGAAKL